MDFRGLCVRWAFMSTTKKVAVPVAASAALFVAKVIGGKKK